MNLSFSFSIKMAITTFNAETITDAHRAPPSVAVCCSVLQCQRGNNDIQRRDFHRRPQSPAICCSVLKCIAVSACPLSPTPTEPRHLLQCVAVSACPLSPTPTVPRHLLLCVAVCFIVSVPSHQSIGMLETFAKSNISCICPHEVQIYLLWGGFG